MTLCPRLRQDLDRLRRVKGRGALAAWLDGLLLDNGFQALVAYRTAHTLKAWGLPLLPALCRRWSIAFCGIDILPAADIGGGCIIAHGLGLVIGGATKIGEDCTLLHGVTLGEVRFDELVCPTLGDRVTIGARATVLGGITIGDDALIGAGSVVLIDVPAKTTAAGVPARLLGPTSSDSDVSTSSEAGADSGASP